MVEFFLLAQLKRVIALSFPPLSALIFFFSFFFNFLFLSKFILPCIINFLWRFFFFFLLSCFLSFFLPSLFPSFLPSFLPYSIRLLEVEGEGISVFRYIPHQKEEKKKKKLWNFAKTVLTVCGVVLLLCLFCLFCCCTPTIVVLSSNDRTRPSPPLIYPSRNPLGRQDQTDPHLFCMICIDIQRTFFLAGDPLLLPNNNNNN